MAESNTGSLAVYRKLQSARVTLQAIALKKSGHNKFASYDYFELGDFLPVINRIFEELGLCSVVSYGKDLATLTIVDSQEGGQIVITSPMAEAQLKGCHPIQNLGAVETYSRRYLYMTALEIVEHDALDSAPPVDKPAVKEGVGVHKATDGAKALLTNAQIELTERLYGTIVDCFDAGDVQLADQAIKSANLEPEMKVYLWDMLDSKQRSALKKIAATNTLNG